MRMKAKARMEREGRIWRDCFWDGRLKLVGAMVGDGKKV
jgi:hypothetical protein